MLVRRHRSRRGSGPRGPQEGPPRPGWRGRRPPRRGSRPASGRGPRGRASRRVTCSSSTTWRHSSGPRLALGLGRQRPPVGRRDLRSRARSDSGRRSPRFPPPGTVPPRFPHGRRHIWTRTDSTKGGRCDAETAGRGQCGRKNRRWWARSALGHHGHETCFASRRSRVRVPPSPQTNPTTPGAPPRHLSSRDEEGQRTRLPRLHGRAWRRPRRNARRPLRSGRIIERALSRGSRAHPAGYRSVALLSKGSLVALDGFRKDTQRGAARFPTHRRPLLSSSMNCRNSRRSRPD